MSLFAVLTSGQAATLFDFLLLSGLSSTGGKTLGVFNTTMLLKRDLSLVQVLVRRVDSRSEGALMSVGVEFSITRVVVFHFSELTHFHSSEQVEVSVAACSVSLVLVKSKLVVVSLGVKGEFLNLLLVEIIFISSFEISLFFSSGLFLGVEISYNIGTIRLLSDVLGAGLFSDLLGSFRNSGLDIQIKLNSFDRSFVQAFELKSVDIETLEVLHDASLSILSNNKLTVRVNQSEC